MRTRIWLAAGLGAVAIGGLVIDAPRTEAATGHLAAPEDELTKEFFTQDAVAPMRGPEAYDLTIVEYTDYQCPYCRMSNGALEALLKEDPKVRVLYRDWPVFGAASVRASKLAIASQWQDKHAAFHHELMAINGKLDEDKIRDAAKRAGVDWERLEADLAAHEAEIDDLLDRNGYQAATLGLGGTPGFIVGDILVPGALDLAALRKLVRKARQKRDGE